MAPLLFADNSVEKIQCFAAAGLTRQISKFFHKNRIVCTQPARQGLPGYQWKGQSISQRTDNFQSHHRSSAFLTTAAIAWTRLILQANAQVPECRTMVPRQHGDFVDSPRFGAV